MAKFVGRIAFPCTIEQGRGLEGAITNVTRVGYVDGETGTLVYRGYSIEDLHAHASFEEAAYLLLHGELPGRAELAGFEDKLRRAGRLPEPVIDLIASMPKGAHPMNVLQSAVAALGCFDGQAEVVTRHVSHPAAAVEADTAVAVRLLATMPTIAGAIARMRQGKLVLQPDPGLSFAGNLLYMALGEPPDETAERVMNAALVLQADHGMNTSTFTAMVVHSTLSDLYASVAAAIGALRGPLHGGSYEVALDDLLSIGSPDKAKAWVEKRIAGGQKIIGFGHRVYRTDDIRVAILKQHAETLCGRKGMRELYETAVIVEQAVRQAMAARDRKVFPNMGFITGLVFHALGFPSPLFPVIFAVSRTAGWLARVIEYLPENRIFCPRAAYAGPVERRYVPLEER